MRGFYHSVGSALSLEPPNAMAQVPALACRLELPPFGAGNGQMAVAARAERQDQPPPGPRALGIAAAGGDSVGAYGRVTTEGAEALAHLPSVDDVLRTMKRGCVTANGKSIDKKCQINIGGFDALRGP